VVSLAFGAMLASGGAFAQAPAPAPSGGGVPVTVATVSHRDVPILLRNIGSVQANQSVLIRTRVDGTLEKVFFTEGQDVKRGDKIALIDPRPYQAAFDQSVARRASDEANLTNAKLDLARSADLARNQYASRQTVDTRQAAVAQLEAQIKADEAAMTAAKVNLDYTNITAPFDGRVGLRMVDVGNVVRFADTSGQGIVTITQIHPITVVFTMPQDALPNIQAAMTNGKLPVFAFSGDDKIKLSEGLLLTTDNAIDATTGTIKLKAVFENADNKLWPGQFINVRLQLEVQKGALVVPSVAVQRGPNGLFVYVVKPDSTVGFQPVTLGQDDGAFAVVTKGLDDGAQVVVNGMSRLQNGTRIAATAAKPNS
jgi:multidrug efflux system membrane fusion protein